MRFLQLTTLASAVALALPVQAASMPDTSRALKTLMEDSHDAPVYAGAKKGSYSSEASEKTVTVMKGDTLAKILARYPGLMPPTQAQVFKAVVSLNPEAFVGGNPNRLIVGSQLQLPEPSELAALAAGRMPTKASKKDYPSDAKVASSQKVSGSNHREDPHAGWVRFPSR
jgi:pilus assembly protein FimV